MADRHLLDATPSESPRHEDVQQLIEAERGLGTQGVLRLWQASNSDKTVLVSDAAGVRISADDGTTAPSRVLVESRMDELLPPGTVWAFAGAVAPAGWLLCDGASLSRAAYPTLFAVIGITYGAVDGSSFTLPNLVGRFVLGASGSHPPGEYGGAETGGGHTHPGNHQHVMAHTHSLNGHDHDTDLQHLHTISETDRATQTGELATPTGAGTFFVSRDTHTHEVNTPALGVTNRASGPPSIDATSASTSSDTDVSGVVHAAAYTDPEANLPPYVAMNWMIRTGV